MNVLWVKETKRNCVGREINQEWQKRNSYNIANVINKGFFASADSRPHVPLASKHHVTYGQFVSARVIYTCPSQQLTLWLLGP
jgi:hypothetical protein